jgi:hypothetical protein
MTGEVLFLADAWEGLRVVDVSDPAAPREVARMEELVGPKFIVTGGDYAYLINSGQYGMPYTLWVVNISQPEQPLLIDSVMVTVHEVTGLSQSGSFLALAIGFGGVQLYDLTNPTLPTLTGSYMAGEENYCDYVLLSGATVIASFWNGVHLLDISDPTQPRLRNILDTHAESMDRSGNYLFIGTGYERTILTVNISDPEHPVVANTYTADYEPYGIQYQENYLYVLGADWNTYSLHILDDHDPAAPHETGWYQIPDVPNAFVVNSSLAFTAQTHALVVYDGSASVPVSPPANPVLVYSFALHLPRPNPFNVSTAIGYELPAASFVSLNVYDTSGRLVSTLIDGWREAGTHETTFEGSKLASGIYLAKLEAGEYTAVQKLVLLK